MKDASAKRERTDRKEERRQRGRPFKEPFLPYLLELAGLQPQHTVLDVGCGAGAITEELAGFLTGSYHGIEVQRDQVERLRAEYPKWTFHFADLANSTYNSSGQSTAAAYALPFEDGSVDTIILRSVFTHLLPDATVRYLQEIARVLRPGGRCLSTWFLLNRDGYQHVAAATATTPGSFPVDRGFYRIRSEDDPERAVAYDEAWVREQHRLARLEIVTTRYGWWCRRDGLSRQDIVVMTPRTQV